MRVISAKKLREFWTDPRYKDSEQSLRAWYAEAVKARWGSPRHIKAKYGSASILRNGRVVFNICGNKYRLIVAIKYDFAIVYIRFVGTHTHYDTINAEEI